MGRRRAREALVSARHPAAGTARLLRRALLDRRGGLDVLPRADAPDGAGLGRPDAGRVRDAREGVRVDDAPPGEARAAAGVPSRRDAGRRARPGRPPAARGAQRGVPRVPRRAGAAARGGEARRAALPDAALRGLEGLVTGLPGVGARPVRGRRLPVRATPSLLVRGRRASGAVALARGAAHVVGGRRRATALGRKRSGDACRGDVADRLRPVSRAERSHVERSRRVRGRAVRPPLQRRGAARVGAAAA